MLLPPGSAALRSDGTAKVFFSFLSLAFSNFANDFIFARSYDGSGQQCCYDLAGYLMMSSDNKWGGNPLRYHNLGLLPWNEANKIPTLSHYLSDVMPFYPCCIWQSDQSTGCQAFRFERRSSQDCVGYQPPGGGAVFGDPHFYTFDGMPYTFNGKGEFVLVRADSPRVKLDVQGRFEQVNKN